MWSITLFYITKHIITQSCTTELAKINDFKTLPIEMAEQVTCNFAHPETDCASLHYHVCLRNDYYALQ